MEEVEYLTVRELEEDLRLVTGNAGFAKVQAESFAIYYGKQVIDAALYKNKRISKEELIYSRHINWKHQKYHSRHLYKNMIAAGKGPRPGNTAAHHIVAWDDMRAAKSRMRLAAFGIDIDDAENGVFLPRFGKNTPMKGMENAMAHSKTHTTTYFLNVETLLDQTVASNLGRAGIIETLEDIAEDLQHGEFPLNKRLKL